MNNSQVKEKYIRTQVNTASPGELTLLLYNGCLKFMQKAYEAIEHKDYETKNAMIARTQDILNELIITLNKEYEISRNLESLYVYINDLLLNASMKLDLNSLKESMDLVKELRDVWAQAMKQLKATETVKS